MNQKIEAIRKEVSEWWIQNGDLILHMPLHAAQNRIDPHLSGVTAEKLPMYVAKYLSLMKWLFLYDHSELSNTKAMACLMDEPWFTLLSGQLHFCPLCTWYFSDPDQPCYCCPLLYYSCIRRRGSFTLGLLRSIGVPSPYQLYIFADLYTYHLPKWCNSLLAADLRKIAAGVIVKTIWNWHPLQLEISVEV